MKRANAVLRVPIVVGLKDSFFVLWTLFLTTHSFAQCPNDNIFWTDLTPTTVGIPVTNNGIWGGEYVTVTVCQGASYTFQTCGSTWDTAITLYNNSGGAALATNDDGCGLQSSITWTASFSGVVRVLVDFWDCTSYAGAAILTVTQTSACGGGGGGGGCAGTTVSVNMIDSFGDGWNGSTYTIINTATNATVATGTMITGSTATDAVCLPDGCYSMVVSAGTYPGEVSWNISGVDGGVVSGFAPATIPFSINTDCSGGGTGDCETYTFQAGGGLFPEEISWTISGPNGIVGTGFATAGVDFCLPAGCYTLELFDSFGDGWDGAQWFLIFNGTIVNSGTLVTGSYLSTTISIGGADCGGPIGGEVLQVATGVLTPQQLITDVFLGDCLSASNIVFTGSTGAIGTFSNGGSIGIESGIILTTGSVFDAPGPNGSGSTSVITASGGNALLDMISGNITYDASVFTFDFVAQTDQVSFNYVFASEEYPEFVCSSFNDAFGFFVSGPGYAPNTNIAIVPGTFDPVTINNVNNNGAACPPFYPAYFVDNFGGSFLEYDGYTVPLTATITTVPCQTYQIVIAVADVGDQSYDSAVFLEAQSFTAGVDVQIGAAATVSGGQSSSVNCEETGYFLFVNDGEPFTEPMTLTFTVSGTALTNPIPTSITFQPGEQSVILDVEAVIGALGVDPTSVVITLDPDQGCSCDDNSITAELFFCAQLMLPVEWLTFEALLSADEREVRCTWETLSERDNDYFVLERSADGTSWIDLGTVAGNGTSNDLNSYTFLDRSPLQGTSYYRVRQVDYHGAIDHSPIRSIERKENDQLGAYPNPGNGVFVLSGYTNGDLAVYNLSGRRVPFSLNFRGELTLHEAAAGWYVIELAHEDPEKSQRITVVVQ